VSDSQDLFNYRFQSGSFYRSIPTSAGQIGNGVVAWKPGFPQSISRPYFFWVQASANINLETRVYRLNQKWNLFDITYKESGAVVSTNYISDAVDFLPTVEQNNASVEYHPELYEYYAAFSLSGNVATLAESPTVVGYLPLPAVTYAWTEDSIVLVEGDFDLVPD
jgi:hypothetical protein